MATLTDLIDISEREHQTIAGFWYGRVVKPVPVDQTTKMYVVIPDISASTKWGPFRWPISEIPTEGQECLVVFDNRQNGWIVALW